MRSVPDEGAALQFTPSIPRDLRLVCWKGTDAQVQPLAVLDDDTRANVTPTVRLEVALDEGCDWRALVEAVRQVAAAIAAQNAAFDADGRRIDFFIAVGANPELITYDVLVDAAYVQLTSRGVVKTEVDDGGWIIDRNADGSVAGYELLNWRRGHTTPPHISDAIRERLDDLANATAVMTA